MVADESMGPRHDASCMAPRHKGAPCRCARGSWLDELVPRHQARAELLDGFETMARQQQVFLDGDLQVLAQRPDLSGLGDPGVAQYATAGINAAQVIARGLWQRIAVQAMNLRAECTDRAVKPTPSVPEPARPRAGAFAEQVGEPDVAEPEVFVQTVLPTGGLL